MTTLKEKVDLINDKGEWQTFQEHMKAAILAAQDAGRKDAKAAREAFMGEDMMRTCFKVGFTHALCESAKTQSWLTTNEYVELATMVWTDCLKVA